MDKAFHHRIIHRTALDQWSVEPAGFVARLYLAAHLLLGSGTCWSSCFLLLASCFFASCHGPASCFLLLLKLSWLPSLLLAPRIASCFLLLASSSCFLVLASCSVSFLLLDVLLIVASVLPAGCVLILNAVLPRYWLRAALRPAGCAVSQAWCILLAATCWLRPAGCAPLVASCCHAFAAPVCNRWAP